MGDIRYCVLYKKIKLKNNEYFLVPIRTLTGSVVDDKFVSKDKKTYRCYDEIPALDEDDEIVGNVYSKEYFIDDNILGLHVHYDGDYIKPVNEGKEQIIMKEVAPKYNNEKPILACGDSRGDFFMLKMSDIKVKLGDNDTFKKMLDEENISYYNYPMTKKNIKNFII